MGDDKGSDPFRIPSRKESDPDGVNAETSNQDDAKGKAPVHSRIEILVPKRTRRARRPRKYRRRHSDSTVDSAETALRTAINTTDRDNTATSSGHDTDRRKPPQSVLRHTSSNNTLETKSRHDSGADLTYLNYRQRPPGTPPSKRPAPLQRLQRTSSPLASIRAPDSPLMEFKWFPVRNRSTSDSASIPKFKPPATRRAKDLPLKPSLKQKSKSTTTTPPSERALNAEDKREGQKLRKVKTVDFEQTVSQKLLSLPPLKVWAEGTTPSNSTEPQRPKASESGGRTNLRDTLKRARSCIGPKTKSRPADAAITRTDVHVVAIAPSSRPADSPQHNSVVLPTPTMQIVESKTGRYEVIWDDVTDVPPERDLRTQRRSSSASQSLHAAASATRQGLERVNSKLSEWSYDAEIPIQPFSPQVVVYPDDDCQVAQVYEDTVDDDLLPIFAPPNSEATTASASRHSSHPASARPSRVPSHEGDSDSDEVVGLLQKKTTPKSTSDTVTFPISPGLLQPEYGILTSRGKKKSLSDRRLSNIEDSEVHFRGHRDSVQLAHDRISHASEDSPERIRARDSVSAGMAKKRIKAKNLSGLSSHNLSYPDMDDSESLLPRVDVTLSKPRKLNASKSLQNNVSSSTLGPNSSPHRHIRIME